MTEFECPADTELDLKVELAEAERLMNAKKREADKLRKKIRNSAPYRKAEKLYNDSEKKKGILYEKIKKLENRLWVKFVTGGYSRASYNRRSYSYMNNIRPEVISAIKKHIKIGRLRDSDVEKVVGKLADILALKTDIPKLKRELDKVRSLHYDVAWDKKTELMRPVENLDREFVNLKDRATELKNELTKPKHYVAHKERVSERDKVDYPDVIKAIFKELKI